MKNHVIHSFLALVVLVLMLAGYGGARVIPTGERVRNADMQFDAAEAFLIQADRDTEQDKWREQVEQRKSLYDEALNIYRAVAKAAPTGKLAQRSLWQISEIYSRRYDWHKVIESYNAITAIAPLSYYGDRAKSAIADMRKYRGLIEEAQRKYKEYSALYVQNNARESYDITAQALYDVAESYEELGDYPEAISYYQRMVDEFPKHEKAPVALSRIGHIHFYRFYDYKTGRPTFYKVIEMYSDSYEATQAIRLLKDTDRTLREIANCETDIERYRSMKAKENEKSGRKIVPNERYCEGRYVDIVALCFQYIARLWEDLGHYPRAIVTCQALVDERSDNESAVADALYQIGRLYQLNGQLDQAIDAYRELFDNNPESLWRAEGIYQQAVCYREVREFTKAYEGFKAYMNLGSDAEYHQEAQQIVRQFETDQDGDGYKSYVEQEAGTSDQDPADFPRPKS